MALINRMSRLFTADVHAVLDRIEEPDVLLKHAVREMEEELARGEQRARVLAHEHETLGERRRKSGAMLAELTSQLDVCFENGNEEQLARARALYEEVRQAAARRGYTPYRGHIDNMDDIAAEFSFNNHAALRFQETLKDALDPNGVLSPGKQGVWPANRRHRKADA